jgi:hypothetical protein
MAIEIVIFPIKNGGSFHRKMFVYQRVHIESLKTPNSWQFPMGKCRGFNTMGCGTAGNLLFRTFDIRLKSPFSPRLIFG